MMQAPEPMNPFPFGFGMRYENRERDKLTLMMEVAFEEDTRENSEGGQGQTTNGEHGGLNHQSSHIYFSEQDSSDVVRKPREPPKPEMAEESAVSEEETETEMEEGTGDKDAKRSLRKRKTSSKLFAPVEVFDDEDEDEKKSKKLGFLSEAFVGGLQDLRNFKAEFGHTNVPCNNKGYAFLGSWVARQRTKKRKGVLSAEETEALEELGFVWNLHRENFKQKADELRSFKEKHGHVDVSKHKTSSLGTWVETQRKKKKKGLLKQEEIEALEQIGFVWEPVKKYRRLSYG